METNETNTTETTPVVEQKKKRNSPDATQFAQIWNASDSRKDVLKRLAAAGFDMTYSAMVARHKSYTKQGIHLKNIAAADRGRRLNVAAVNAVLDQPQA